MLRINFGISCAHLLDAFSLNIPNDALLTYKVTHSTFSVKHLRAGELEHSFQLLGDLG